MFLFSLLLIIRNFLIINIFWRDVHGHPKMKKGIAIIAKYNQRVSVISMVVAAALGKILSASTVCRRFYMKGLYAQVPLPFQAKGEKLKRCCQHVNWTVSDHSVHVLVQICPR